MIISYQTLIKYYLKYCYLNFFINHMITNKLYENYENYHNLTVKK